MDTWERYCKLLEEQRALEQTRRSVRRTSGAQPDRDSPVDARALAPGCDPVDEDACSEEARGC